MWGHEVLHHPTVCVIPVVAHYTCCGRCSMYSIIPPVDLHPRVGDVWRCEVLHLCDHTLHVVSTCGSSLHVLWEMEHVPSTGHTTHILYPTYTCYSPGIGSVTYRSVLHHHVVPHYTWYPMLCVVWCAPNHGWYPEIEVLHEHVELAHHLTHRVCGVLGHHDTLPLVGCVGCWVHLHVYLTHPLYTM